MTNGDNPVVGFKDSDITVIGYDVTAATKVTGPNTPSSTAKFGVSATHHDAAVQKRTPPRGTL